MEIKSKSKEKCKKIIRHKVDENASNFLTSVTQKRHHCQNEMIKKIRETKLDQKFKLTGLETNDNLMKTTVTDSKWKVQDKSENKLSENCISENDSLCEETGNLDEMKLKIYPETVQVNRKLMTMKI